MAAPTPQVSLSLAWHVVLALCSEEGSQQLSGSGTGSTQRCCSLRAHLCFTGLPDLIGSSSDERDAHDLPVLSHLQDAVNAAQSDAELHNQDQLPALVSSSDSGSDSVPDLESVSDHDDIYFDHDSDDTEPYEGNGHDEMPPLIDIHGHMPADFTTSFTDLGGNQPLTLDQLDAVDRLSHVMEEAEDVAASGNLVRPVQPSHPIPHSPRSLRSTSPQSFCKSLHTGKCVSSWVASHKSADRLWCSTNSCC